MARKNRTPEENARREKIRELLQMSNIGRAWNASRDVRKKGSCNMKLSCI